MEHLECIAANCVTMVNQQIVRWWSTDRYSCPSHQMELPTIGGRVGVKKRCATVLPVPLWCFGKSLEKISINGEQLECSLGNSENVVYGKITSFGPDTAYLVAICCLCFMWWCVMLSSGTLGMYCNLEYRHELRIRPMQIEWCVLTGLILVIFYLHDA